MLSKSASKTTVSRLIGRSSAVDPLLPDPLGLGRAPAQNEPHRTSRFGRSRGWEQQEYRCRRCCTLGFRPRIRSARAFQILAQQKLLREYARSQGLTIAREFVDVETAKQTGRVDFGQMLAFLKADPTCRTILVEKTDRLYGNIRDWITVDELDLSVHFVKENAIVSNASRSSEKFMHGIKVLMAKNYVDYQEQLMAEKRRLLETVRSNCSFDRGSLCPTYVKPFDVLTSAVETGDWRVDGTRAP